jgi:hypothetical protein
VSEKDEAGQAAAQLAERWGDKAVAEFLRSLVE